MAEKSRERWGQRLQEKGFSPGVEEMEGEVRPVNEGRAGLLIR